MDAAVLAPASQLPRLLPASGCRLTELQEHPSRLQRWGCPRRKPWGDQHGQEPCWSPFPSLTSWCPLLPSPLGDLSLWSHPDPANPPATASLVRQELAFRSTPCLIFEFKPPSPRNAGRGTHKLTGSPPVLPASKEDPTLQVTHQCWQTAKQSSYWK